MNRPDAQAPGDRVAVATARLARWLVENGIAGYDPYDLLGHRLYLALAKTPRAGFTPKALLARAASAAAYRAPIPTRRLLGVHPSVNAKAVGLLLSAWTRLRTLGDPRAAEQCEQLAEWLVSNTEPGYPGASWGYPFHWQSRVFIPKGTPSAVVTSTCAQALLDHAEATGDERARETARGAADFLTTGLNRYESPDGGICLSYTPIDDFRVHNASLMAGEYLLRASKAFGESAWGDLAQCILAYTVADQSPDGSFEYWGSGQREGSHVDNYHTGFVLRSLAAFSDAGAAGAADALDRGWRYYADHFFSEAGRPLDLGGRLLPLNIHSCAESILCPATLASRHPDALGLARAAAVWTIERMTNPDGSFAYMLRESGIDGTPYLRWGQAWMLRALAELLHTEAGST